MIRVTAVAVPGSIRLRTSDVACTAHPTMIKTNVAQAGTVSGHAPGPLRTPATGLTRAGTRVVTKTIATTTVAGRSEARPVGKEWGSTCRPRWSAYRTQKQ